MTEIQDREKTETNLKANLKISGILFLIFLDF